MKINIEIVPANKLQNNFITALIKEFLYTLKIFFEGKHKNNVLEYEINELD